MTDTSIRQGWEAEGGKKLDAGKPRMDLLDSFALVELSKVLDFGAVKYAPNNWRKGIRLSRLLAASMRHLTSIMHGENVDEETGLQHAAHLMCCAMFLIWTIEHRKDMDDRWNTQHENQLALDLQVSAQTPQEKKNG